MAPRACPLIGAPPTANSEAWLKDKVKVTLLFHRSVSAGKTEVDVKDSIVTLRGNAASQAQKELTTEYARDVEGVKDVNILWALGLVSSYTMGGFIHLLLIIALIVVVVGFLQGRRAG